MIDQHEPYTLFYQYVALLFYIMTSKKNRFIKDQILILTVLIININMHL